MHSDGQIELAQWTAQRIKEIIDAHKTDSLSILDVGCGGGQTAYYLQDILWESRVVGVDRDHAVIKNAQEEFPEMRFFTCNDRLPIEDNSFDCVYAAYVFHHLKIDDQKKLINEMMGVLRPSGLLIIFEFNPWHLPTVWHFWRNPEEKNAKMVSPSKLKSLFASSSKVRVQYSHPLFLAGSVYSICVEKTA